jgi:hypothetical protein
VGTGVGWETGDGGEAGEVGCHFGGVRIQVRLWLWLNGQLKAANEQKM